MLSRGGRFSMLLRMLSGGERFSTLLRMLSGGGRFSTLLRMLSGGESSGNTELLSPTPVSLECGQPGSGFRDHPPALQAVA